MAAAVLYCFGFLLTAIKSAAIGETNPNVLINQGQQQNIQPIINTKRLFVPYTDNSAASETTYTPYNVKLYQFSPEDAIDNYNRPINGYSNGYGGQFINDYDNNEQKAINEEFASIEQNTGNYDDDDDLKNEDQYYDTTGYKHYKTQTSFSLTGPKQLEQITTNSYHREVEPYDIGDFKLDHKEHEHHGEEEHAEVHYHQHKHLHKHSHKQQHVHKHKGEHKHEHGHKHAHNGKHSHKHEGHHKHSHHSMHKHEHKGEHKHSHHGEHKHSHHGHHSHDHKHHSEHKHNGHHAHKHSHHNEHKHSHHSEHSHDHHHGHTHHNDHKHKHSHHASHKHHHGHKNEHKHEHHSKHKHSHKHHKH